MQLAQSKNAWRARLLKSFLMCHLWWCRRLEIRGVEHSTTSLKYVFGVISDGRISLVGLD